MAAEVTDYRVSKIVILCKDCGQDVGPYPARHKCGIPSSETPPLPSIPKKYSTGKTSSSSSNMQSNNSDHSNEGLWNKLRSIRNRKDPEAEDVADNSRLWNKLLSATSLNNNDSDNDSEKDGWEGESHISRILREYYENKEANLPDWLFDSDSKTTISSNNYRRQMTPNLNNTNNDNNNDLNNNVGKGHQRIYDSRELLTPPTSMNKSRGRNVPPPNLYNDQYTSSLQKNMNSGYDHRGINNPRGRQLSPNSTSDDGRLKSIKSQQQLRIESGSHDPSHIPTNRSRSVSPNPPSHSHQYQQFIPRDVKRFNYNSNQYKGDGHNRQDRQRALPSGLRDPGRNNRHDFF